jgi:hypothetical protein
VIIKFFQSHRYNAAVLKCTKTLVWRHFTDRQFLIERLSKDYLNYSDSIRYTDFFRQNNVSVEVAAIHYFDFGIEQLRKILNMSHQDDVAELVAEMEQGLDQMLLAHLRKISPDNGKIGAALSGFLSDLEQNASEQPRTFYEPGGSVVPVGEQ